MSLIQRFTTRNVGTVDRVIRTLPTVVVLVLWSTGTLTGTTLIAAAGVSVMLLLTAITSRCSIYAMLGISTCPANKA